MVVGGKKFGLLKREMGQEEGIINPEIFTT